MYKFKSRVTGDLIMLEPNGRQILIIVGKNDAESLLQGILLPPQMPAAIAALEAAIAQEDAARAQQQKSAKETGEPAPRAEGISLRLRATPFIAMLRRCHQADQEIVWGV